MNLVLILFVIVIAAYCFMTKLGWTKIHFVLLNRNQEIIYQNIINILLIFILSFLFLQVRTGRLEAPNINIGKISISNVGQKLVMMGFDKASDSDKVKKLELLLRGKTKESLSETATPLEDFEYEIKNSSATILKYNGVDENVEVPNVIKGYRVVTIGDEAFKENKYIESVVLPDSVMYIGSYAFQNCGSLTSVEGMHSLTIIYNGAFKDCTSLEAFTINETGTDKYIVQSIGTSAFENCSNLTSIKMLGDTNIKSEVKTSAFLKCTSLTSVELPFYTSVIGPHAFGDCINLSEIEYNNITEIGNNAFENCRSLLSVTISGYVTKIGDYAYKGCSSVSILQLGGYTPAKKGADTNIMNASIGDHAFEGTAVVEVTVPYKYNSIGDGAFKGCTALEYFSIEDTGENKATQKIGSSVFSGATRLVSVTLPMSIKSIGSWKISDTPSATIYAPAKSVPYEFATENGFTFVEQ